MLKLGITPYVALAHPFIASYNLLSLNNIYTSSYAPQLHIWMPYLNAICALHKLNNIRNIYLYVMNPVRQQTCLSWLCLLCLLHLFHLFRLLG